MAEANVVVLSLICHFTGVVKTILRDDMGIMSDCVPNCDIRSVVDSESVEKMLNFLSELRVKRAVADWYINVPVNGNVQSLVFAGGAVKDDLVIVAASSHDNIDEYFDELARMNNEHSNTVRMVLKERMLNQQRTPHPDVATLEELTQLNNELSNTQRELAKKNSELARLNEEKNRFLGMAAHDLRTPLNVISGYSELLLEEWEELTAEEGKEILRHVTGSCKYMLSLVNGFLDYTKIESGTLQLQKERVEFEEFLVEATAAMGPHADAKGIELVLEIPDTLPHIELDPNRISQVMSNLISNAIKFSPRASKITVAAQQLHDIVKVTVTDEGPGIPKEELNRLFQPFMTTSVTGSAGEKSTGLGLLIVRKIVLAHGGSLSVNSTVGNGSSFGFELPAR